jgi:thiamine-monophosphate kinase
MVSSTSGGSRTARFSPPAGDGPLGERALIAAIRARAARPGAALRLGIGDDCAILRPPAGHEIVVTTDLSLEHVHFRRDWHPPESVGHRCLARGLSDLAGMGARPLAAFLSLAVPPALARRIRGSSWLDRFLDGLLALAEEAGVPLAGGDTAQSPVVAAGAAAAAPSGLAVADIVLLGSVPRGRALLRSGARPGDRIYVTGALGGAAAELLALERNPAKFARMAKAVSGHPHLYPIPRLAVASRLASSRSVHAAIDLSDGLSTDLAHICEESGVAAEIHSTAVPIHPLASQAEEHRRASSALDLALHGGEDYELLFTAPKSAKVPRSIGGVKLSHIGEILKPKAGRPLVSFVRKDGTSGELKAAGWEHFQPSQ